MLAYCKKHELPLQTELIPEGMGAKIHWLGDRSLQKCKVILYFHGTFYWKPLRQDVKITPSFVTKDHQKMIRNRLTVVRPIQFVVRCSKVLQDKGERAVIAFVEYGLTPENRYPTQYLQAVRALNYVLQKDYQPADLILGGDSAGGNICLAIMSLALHAANDTLSQPTLPSPLAGVFLICPWVSFQSSSSSYRDNAAIDIVLAPQMHHWAEAFLPVALAASQRLDDSVIHNLVEPVSAETAWWKGFPAQQVLMVGGDKEVFRDDIKELGKKLAGASVTTSTVICENQIHIECILDAQYGDTPGKMSVTIWDWLARLVS
ncbi:uncharacterized protein A1O5_06214 [Cladophialophora psammophila CBS 110553]|uniref:Alpha/beta hydrolase fold-3 domain-containing protein n=1 Tax=Cladophialophora psammophila CBS 110553 TaxID=1182543 RepID=W9WZN7_9EURO|nr:uncharacterized protein A1O5_06214 [Cladophialophora psammophila CBS 110553]EXJ70146.1 hypothetical protein A1O5_06214 [Cladophialophora psammophila CBS 110553]